ncbi:unnamed protein product [Caenorhabditis brenneri]
MEFEISICSLNPNDYQMVVTYGKPSKFTTPKILKITFEDCVQECWVDPTCVLVYDTSPTCQMFNLANITTVQKLNSSSNSRIAFRTYSTSSTCPNLTTTPILVGGTVTGNTYYSPGTNVEVYQEFNITFNTKTSTWSFTSTVYYPCLYMLPITRGGKVYCFMLGMTSQCMNKTASLAFLGTTGYTLMGIADMWEYEYFKNTAISYMSLQAGSKNYTRIGFWIDGIRKSTCKYPAVSSGACNGTNEFAYSDKTAPKPVFEWAPGQPNGLLNDPPNSNCLYLRASNNGDSGVDDMPCNYSVDPTLDLCLYGALMGTPANPNAVS